MSTTSYAQRSVDSCASMPLTRLTSLRTDPNRVRTDPFCIRRPRAFAAIFAIATTSFLAGCGEPPKPVAKVPPPAAAATTSRSTITIECPARGPFGNGPTYYSQYYEDYILGYVFKDYEHGFYVDVGANDPDDMSVTKYFYLAGWRGINIEPIPELVAKLKKSRPEAVARSC